MMSKRENTPANSAQNYFRRAELDEASAKQIRKKERAAEAAKTANLRRLRLEKESRDKEAADKLAAENGGQPAKPARRPKAARKRKAVRMVY
jgi:hypothetical protein